MALALVACGSSSSDGTAGGGGTSNGGSGGANVSGASGWVSGGAAGTTSSGGTGALPPLDCDSRFSISDDPATAGVAFDVTVTDSSPYAYVDLEVSGPGSPSTAWGGVAGSGPWSWTWTVSGHAAGVLDLTFKKDKNGGNPGTTVATCQMYSVDAGSGGSGGGTGGTGTGGTGTGGTTSGPPPANRYGIGLVNEGNATDHDLAQKLAGPGGWILVIFADITPNRTSADASWKQSIQAAYDRNLIPVIRMAPPWGDRKVRNMGESPTAYKKLAQAYKAVIQDLPKRPDWPLYVQVHNEPNLCYEWECDSSAGTLTDQTIASEYAHMLSDVADALHSIGDPRIKVLNGALAPGEPEWCQCGTTNAGGGKTSTTFLGYMKSAVPGVFDKIDAFATHSYPAQGEGWGFFVQYSDSLTGLKWFEKELQTIGKSSMKVVVTETGWTIQHETLSWSRDQVADFTVDAVKNVWLTHPNILGVTPFILRDGSGSWENFAWTHGDGTPYPVYTKVRAYRCSQAGAQNCN
jgi:hypothetical protein